MPVPQKAQARGQRSSALTGAGIFVAGLALLLSGCASTPTNQSADTEQVQLHPTGDAGRWFSDEYAAGVSNIYSTNDTVCGIESGYIVESMTNIDGDWRVQARRLSDGQLTWSLNDTKCSADSLLDDSVLVYPTTTATLEDWALVDVANGQSLQTFTLDGARHVASQIGRAGELRVIKTSDGFLGLGTEGVAWNFPNRYYNSEFALGDGMFGLNGPNEKNAVLDGTTGEIRLDLSGITSSDITWASDGYVLGINQSDPEYAFYDLDGNEVDRTVGVSQYRFVPATYRGITFALEDQVKAGTIVGVNQEGFPALWEDGSRKNQTQAGEIKDLPDSIIMVQAISESGDYMIYDNHEGDGIIIIDNTGETVFTWPVEISSMRIVDSYIVFERDNTTTVLLPHGNDN